MTRIETKPWDTAEFLGSDEMIRHYLEATFEDGDRALICHAFANVARARGMTALAREAGVARETLYKAFGENGNPTLETLVKVTRALGVKLTIARNDSPEAEPEAKVAVTPRSRKKQAGKETIPAASL